MAVFIFHIKSCFVAVILERLISKHHEYSYAELFVFFTSFYQPNHVSTGGGSLFAIHGDCEAYDTRTDRWHMVASMSTRRARVGVAAIGNRLYAVGG